jgi:nitrous oxidase accessory protein NosD
VPPGELSAILAGASPGTTLRLGPGRYTLTDPVRLASGLVLEGAGPELTEIAAAVGARLHVHLLDPADSVTLRGLSLSQPAVDGATAVVRATCGRLAIADCRLLGGSDGLWVGGSAVVSANAVHLEGAFGTGIRVAEAAGATLTDVTTTAHGGFGLLVGDRAEVSAERLTATFNGRGGAAAEAHATLNLFESELSDNGRRGVLVRSATPGAISRSLIVRNDGPGVEVARTPLLTLDGNRILANTGAGVMVGDGARVDAHANTLSENGEDGLAIYRGSSARLTANDARGNARFGVWVGSGAEATLADNAVVENGRGEYMAAWSAALPTEVASSFSRRSDQSTKAQREHMRPEGRFGFRSRR